MALRDPFACLRTLYSGYAFARRGKDRADLSDLAAATLQRIGKTVGTDFLAEASAKTLWDAFVHDCAQAKRNPSPEHNLGPIAGFAEIAQELYRETGDGGILSWIEREILASGRIESAFFRIVEVRGIGPKVATMILRDFVWLLGMEDQVAPIDRLYLVMVDKWLRLIAPYAIPNAIAAGMPDWILAGKFAKQARLAGVSCIRFGMGASHLGYMMGRDDLYSTAIESLVRNGVTLH